MSSEGIVLLAVVIVFFAIILAGLAYLGFKAFTHLMAAFFGEVRKLNEAASAERTASQEAYSTFLSQMEEREQILGEADREWMSTPESAVAYDQDLEWEAKDG